MEPEEFTERFKSDLELRKFSEEVMNEIKAEKIINSRLDEGTLLTVLGWSGESGMTMSLLRSIIYKHLLMKEESKN